MSRSNGGPRSFAATRIGVCSCYREYLKDPKARPTWLGWSGCGGMWNTPGESGRPRMKDKPHQFARRLICSSNCSNDMPEDGFIPQSHTGHFSSFIESPAELPFSAFFRRLFQLPRCSLWAGRRVISVVSFHHRAEAKGSRKLGRADHPGGENRPSLCSAARIRWRRG